MDLREPLLEPSPRNDEPMTFNTTVEWPTEAARSAKLYIPPSWQCGGGGQDATCVVGYDGNLLSIQSTQEDGRVLDVIHPQDIIGVDLEIKLFGPTEALEHVGFRNTKGRSPEKTTSDENEVKQCNIFKPLTTDVEKIFNTLDLKTQDIPFDTQATAILNIYCYPRKHPTQQTWGNWMGLTSFQPKPNPTPYSDSSKMGHRHAHHRRLEVVRSEDFADIRCLVRAIRNVAQLHSTGVRYLVLLNPMGGPKRAQDIYDTTVHPMLDQAGIDHDVVTTTHARHAQEVVAELDFTLYDGIIAMSGDGILHEVLQGIQTRSDAQQVLDKLQIGVIGCGTSNGLAKSILHESKELYSPLESTFLICKGQTSLMDLSEYATKEKVYTSFLTYSYGMIADIDIDSEVLRCLGSLRLDVWGAYLGLKLKSYPVKLSYLPPSTEEDAASLSLPPLSDDVPSNWVTIEDDIVLLWASQVSHADSNIQSSPSSKLQDGVFQILIVRRGGLSRYKMIKWLLSLDGHGSHVKHCADISEVIECVAWRLEPQAQGSYNDLDGEIVESGPIQGRVLPSAICIFGNSHHQHELV